MMPAGFRVLVFTAVLAICPALLSRARAAEDDALDAALRAARRLESDLVATVRKVRESSASVLHYRFAQGEKDTLLLAGVGSGVLVESKRRTWVLTNVHVVKGAERLEIITCDGGRFEMTLQGSVPRYDIALLAFKETPRLRCRAVRVEGSVSAQVIREGSWVLATGNPMFLALDGRPVATLGVVSGKGRSIGHEFQYVGAVQHDAEVNPGNSGGPLWDLRGRLVGLNGMIISRPQFPGAQPTNIGMSFALPVHQIEAFLGELMDPGTPFRAGSLGVGVRTHVDTSGEPDGAEVSRVPKKRASSVTDLKVGDVIVRLHVVGQAGHTRIRTAADLTERISTLTAGTEVVLKYRRNGRYYRWSGSL